jgi:23S rRNA (guanine745-N1)-methyltransferase
MVAARTRFLDKGHYLPLVKSLHETINDARLGGPLVDLGCGEGYFTCALAKRISRVYGVDVSKPAIRAACKREKSISWVVGTVSRLPLVDGEFSAATVLMAPMSPDVARVLLPAGKLCRVTPATDHLRELKQMMYREVQAHDRASTNLSRFDLKQSNRVTFGAALSVEDLQALVGMTPMRYRATKTLAEAVCDAEITQVTFDFWIDVFEKQR